MRFGLIVILLLFLLTGTWYLLSPQSGKPWSVKKYPNSRVEFFNNHDGVIIGPRVIHTKDAGKAWSIIDYVNPSDSFKPKDNPNHAKLLVDFVDPEWAWRASPTDPQAVEFSNDGARSWSKPIPTGVKARSSLAFLSRDVGWVFGDVPVVTRDRGRTWQEETALANLRFEYPFFLDESHGWVANYWGIIGRTTDSGQHWEIVHTELKNIRGLFFLNPERGWAVGDKGLLAGTEDGGRNWKIVDASVTTELLDVFFLSPELGWIVGQNGLVLITRDGGKSWTRGSTPIRDLLCSVRFVDSLHGWTVGGNPTPAIPVLPPSNVVLETKDGGQNWETRVF